MHVFSTLVLLACRKTKTKHHVPRLYRFFFFFLHNNQNETTTSKQQQHKTSRHQSNNTTGTTGMNTNTGTSPSSDDVVGTSSNPPGLTTTFPDRPQPSRVWLSGGDILALTRDSLLSSSDQPTTTMTTTNRNPNNSETGTTEVRLQEEDGQGQGRRGGGERPSAAASPTTTLMENDSFGTLSRTERTSNASSSDGKFPLMGVIIEGQKEEKEANTNTILIGAQQEEDSLCSESKRSQEEGIQIQKRNQNLDNGMVNGGTIRKPKEEGVVLQYYDENNDYDAAKKKEEQYGLSPFRSSFFDDNEDSNSNVNDDDDDDNTTIQSYSVSMPMVVSSSSGSNGGVENGNVVVHDGTTTSGPVGRSDQTSPTAMTAQHQVGGRQSRQRQQLVRPGAYAVAGIDHPVRQRRRQQQQIRQQQREQLQQIQQQALLLQLQQQQLLESLNNSHDDDDDDDLIGEDDEEQVVAYDLTTPATLTSLSSATTSTTTSMLPPPLPLISALTTTTASSLQNDLIRRRHRGLIDSKEGHDDFVSDDFSTSHRTSHNTRPSVAAAAASALSQHIEHPEHVRDEQNTSTTPTTMPTLSTAISAVLVDPPPVPRQERLTAAVVRLGGGNYHYDMEKDTDADDDADDDEHDDTTSPILRRVTICMICLACLCIIGTTIYIALYWKPQEDNSVDGNIDSDRENNNVDFGKYKYFTYRGCEIQSELPPKEYLPNTGETFLASSDSQGNLYAFLWKETLDWMEDATTSNNGKNTVVLVDALSFVDTAQYQAYVWLAEEMEDNGNVWCRFPSNDGATVGIGPASVRNYLLERYAMATFYYSTTIGRIDTGGTIGSSSWSRDTNWLSHDHSICDWYQSDDDDFENDPVCITTTDATSNEENDIATMATMTPRTASADGYSLNRLVLEDNNLIGTFPNEMGFLSNVKILSIGEGANSNYQDVIYGTIPTTLGHLSHIEYVKLSHNQLSGTVPVELRSWTNLGTLFVFYYDLILKKSVRFLIFAHGIFYFIFLSFYHAISYD